MICARKEELLHGFGREAVAGIRKVSMAFHTVLAGGQKDWAGRQKKPCHGTIPFYFFTLLPFYS